MKIPGIIIFLICLCTDLYSYTISVRVLDEKTGRPVDGISVGIDQIYYFSRTDNKGDVLLRNIDPGNYTLQVSHPDYGIKTLEIKILRDFFITIELKKKSYALNPVNTYNLKHDDRIGSYLLTRQDIKELPGGAGNSFHALQTFPGVGNSFLLSSVPITRGNNPIYNKYYLDEIPVDYPFHYLGTLIPLFSSINEEIIQSIKLMNTPYPARYDDSIGSIIDIKTVEPEGPGFSGKIIFSPVVPLYPAVYVSAVPSPDLSIIFFGKRSDLELYNTITSRASDNNFYSQEHYLKICYNLFSKSRLYFIAFGSDDSVSARTTSLGFDEIRARSIIHSEAMRLEYLVTNRVLLKTTVSDSHLDQEIRNTGNNAGNSTTIKFDPYQYRFLQELVFSNKTVQVNSGFECIHQGGGASGNVNLGSIAESNGFTIDPSLTGNDVMLKTPIQGNTYSFFSDGNINFKPLWLNIGARYKNYGPESSDLFSYRGLIGFEIFKNTALYTGGGSYYAHPDMYYYLGEINPHFHDSRSYNFVMGIKSSVNPSLSGQWELYYSRYKNLYSLDTTAESNKLATLTQITPFSLESDGSSYGSEIYLKSVFKMFEGRISLTYSVSKRSSNSINDKNYYSDFDQRYIVRTILITRAGQWTFSAAWYFFTSFPYTPVTGSTIQNSDYEAVYGSHNSKRYETLPRQEYKLTYNFLSKSRFFINASINPKYQIYQKFDTSKPYSGNNPETQKDIPLFLWMGLELCF